MRLRGEIDDAALAGGAQVNSLVFAETRVTIRGDAVDGLFRAKFADSETARAFDAFADEVLAKVRDTGALAAGPDEFRFDIGDARVFYDAAAEAFGLTPDMGGSVETFDRLERFVEAIVAEEGGTVTRTSNFYERILAWGDGSDAGAVADGTGLSVAGRAVTRGFEAEFASEAEAQAMAEGLNRLFGEIALTGAVPASFDIA
ncbi:hypothetical protein [Mangrovicoccus ximenensis]|uniref:hypothetical protein n=1 Tax=Mangrovicoccus ximenensis TaxID=1911570 RepID=UPI000D3502B1|nr:hypothetical protein [Mangrovicoccus ximenensis]